MCRSFPLPRAGEVALRSNDGEDVPALASSLFERWWGYWVVAQWLEAWLQVYRISCTVTPARVATAR